MSRTWGLGVGFFGLVAIIETERERDESKSNNLNERGFPHRDLSFVNLSIPSKCLVNPDSVRGDCFYRFAIFLFCPLYDFLRFDHLLQREKYDIYLSHGTSSGTHFVLFSTHCFRSFTPVTGIHRRSLTIPYRHLPSLAFLYRYCGYPPSPVVTCSPLPSPAVL